MILPIVGWGTWLGFGVLIRNILQQYFRVFWSLWGKTWILLEIEWINGNFCPWFWGHNLDWYFEDPLFICSCWVIYDWLLKKSRLIPQFIRSLSLSTLLSHSPSISRQRCLSQRASCKSHRRPSSSQRHRILDSVAGGQHWCPSPLPCNSFHLSKQQRLHWLMTPVVYLGTLWDSDYVR